MTSVINSLYNMSSSSKVTCSITSKKYYELNRFAWARKPLLTCKSMLIRYTM